MSNLLKQCVQEQTELPTELHLLYNTHRNKGTRPSIEEIEKTLLIVLSSKARTFIIIDALDEFSISDSSQLEAERDVFLSSLLRLQRNSGINLLVTSRVDNKLSKMLPDAVNLKIVARPEDVEHFIDNTMSQLHSDMVDDNIRKTIKVGVVAAADGL